MSSDAPSHYDVAIVGAGPAGSSAAIRLATAGISVSLFERSSFPREKLCGEFISPDCLGHFEELGIDAKLTVLRGRSIERTVFYSRSGRAAIIKNDRLDSRASRALGLSRAELDNVLLNQAERSGAAVFTETAVLGQVRSGNNGTTLIVRGPSGERRVSAKILIDATGRSRFSEMKAAKAGGTRTAADHVAFKTHLKDARIEPGDCEMFVFPGGYGGCNAVEDGLFNLCFIARARDTRRLGSDPERVVREILFQNTRAAKVLFSAEAVKPWLAVPVDRFGRGKSIPAPGILAIGDAAAFIDPFTGSGILMALQSAKLAAAAVLSQAGKGFGENEIAAIYRETYDSAFAARLRVCSLLRRTAFSPLIAEGLMAGLRLSSPFRRYLARATRSA